MSLEKSRVPLSVTSQHFSYLDICSISQVLMIHATLSSPHQMLCSMVTTKTLSNTLSSFVSQALHGFKIPPSVLGLVILQRYWGSFKWALTSVLLTDCLGSSMQTVSWTPVFCLPPQKYYIPMIFFPILLRISNCSQLLKQELQNSQIVLKSFFNHFYRKRINVVWPKDALASHTTKIDA